MAVRWITHIGGTKIAVTAVDGVPILAETVHTGLLAITRIIIKAVRIARARRNALAAGPRAAIYPAGGSLRTTQALSRRTINRDNSAGSVRQSLAVADLAGGTRQKFPFAARGTAISRNSISIIAFLSQIRIENSVAADPRLANSGRRDTSLIQRAYSQIVAALAVLLIAGVDGAAVIVVAIDRRSALAGAADTSFNAAAGVSIITFRILSAGTFRRRALVSGRRAAELAR